MINCWFHLKMYPQEFEKDVNNGKFKKVSVEIYRNLESKGASLEAVSFLGVAGLSNFTLNALGGVCGGQV